VNLVQRIGNLLRREKAPTNLSTVDHRGGWWSLVRESYTGAWQRNVEVDSDTVLTYFAVYACISLISQDIGKLTPKLMQKSGDVWVETTNPAYSKVLKRPNSYQNWQKFVEQWIISKLSYGATYTLKGFDNRKVVNRLNVLDAQRVVPLVAQDGSVFYDIKKDNLNRVESGYIAVDDEIIHDIYTPLYHPLMGVSPIVACGLTATQGLNIQQNSTNLFANMSRPSGMLMAPGSISPETAARLKTQWEENYSAGNYGRVAILSDGLTYTPMAVNAAVRGITVILKAKVVGCDAVFTYTRERRSRNSIEPMDTISS
jgi:HK97 family phage portal protein